MDVSITERRMENKKWVIDFVGRNIAPMRYKKRLDSLPRAGAGEYDSV